MSNKSLPTIDLDIPDTAAERENRRLRGYSVRELLLLAQNHIPPSQTALRDNIEGWLASHPRGHAMTEPSVEDIERVFESCGEDTLRDFVEILLAQNAALVAALEEARHHFVTTGKLHSLDMRGPIHRIDAALAAGHP